MRLQDSKINLLICLFLVFKESDFRAVQVYFHFWMLKNTHTNTCVRMDMSCLSTPVFTCLHERIMKKS